MLVASRPRKRCSGFGRMTLRHAALLVASLSIGACLSEYVITDEEEQDDASDCPAKMKIWCDGGCVDPRKDMLHCGECFRACEDGEYCDGGDCIVDQRRETSEPKRPARSRS